jgi:hypothetical protein
MGETIYDGGGVQVRRISRGVGRGVGYAIADDQGGHVELSEMAAVVVARAIRDDRLDRLEREIEARKAT